MSHQPLSRSLIETRISAGIAPALISGSRILVIIPDASRNAPIPAAFSVICRLAAEANCQVDFLIALGTHPPMTSPEIASLVGMSQEQVQIDFPGTRIWNHNWLDRDQLTNLGQIPAEEVDVLSAGLMKEDIVVNINKLILDYDQLVVCGPVFPHEVAGFSGGAKYFFPGIAGEEIIHLTHWLGALATAMHTIGVKDTPVRRIIERAAEFIKTPVTHIAFCMRGSETLDIFSGGLNAAWQAAAALSSEVNIRHIDQQFKSVLSMPAPIYDELWTAAKAMYKLEAVVEDGGELIIYAPWLKEISRTHFNDILAVGYHTRDYFTSQWDKFKSHPLAVLAHSTHFKGAGIMQNGIEKPRINVILSTAIPKEICNKVNLGYLDPSGINPSDWENGRSGGKLFVPEAGEVLYQLENFVKKQDRPSYP